MTFTARQSTLRGLQQCPRREWHAVQAGEDAICGNVGDSGRLGTVMHAVAAEILRALHRQQQHEMSSSEAIEIAYKVYAGLPIVLPADEADDLIMLTTRFVERVWRVDRLMTTPQGELAIEQRITAPLRCPDGKIRILSGQPDAIFVGGPRTLIIPDYKTGWGRPKKPNEQQEGVPADTAVGKQYLSDRGHFQGDTYSLSALHEYPGADRVIFRELSLRWGTIREAIFTREDMKNVERRLGDALMKLEKGLAEPDTEWGREFWQPKPGSQCTRQCPVARSCPIPAEQRGPGALETDEDADREAARLIAVEGLRGEMLAVLRARWEETGYPAKIGDGRELRFDGGAGSARQEVAINGNGRN